VVGVPDGANAENAETEQQENPGTPEEQVNREVTSAEVSGWWRSLFGGDPYEAGGGGAGGQFTFANVEELDGIIRKWEDERDGIDADRKAIAEAYHMIKQPAGDIMSLTQMEASKNSLANMWHHSDSMYNYAQNYITKLMTSRAQIATTEDGAYQRIRNVQA
jgi:hypothetical protein